MYVSNQLVQFLEFFLVGIAIAIVFDFFRAYRKDKKVSFLVVAFQDFIYFIIIAIILIFSIVYLLNTSIRAYIFFAIFLGIVFYITLISRYVLNLFSKMFLIIKKLFKFLTLPIRLVIQIISKVYRFFEKNIKKCCKKFYYMILNICNTFLIGLKKNKKTKEVKR